MADPEHDFGIVYDDQGLIQILQSPFFDVDPEVDHTVNDYIERILETVVMAVEDQLGTVEWRLSADPKMPLGWAGYLVLANFVGATGPAHYC
ncbi:hypothetical protein M5K25_006497 [Dendrobium thyrsiflorum]|uniref:Uncharacterized protein n=1 Tax=Dendrobium thyrsiflorum TaxID=117978 RepID=A0ABD0VIZ9_DENTH